MSATIRMPPPAADSVAPPPDDSGAARSAEVFDDATHVRLDAPQATRQAWACATCGVVFSGSARFCPFDGVALERVPSWQTDGDPLVGSTIADRYRVEQLIGEGGMGRVYAARHIAIDKPCAIKVLRREVATEPEAVERFLLEAKTAANLTHDNVVSVTDFGELGREVWPALGDRKLPYFAMDLLLGETLAERLRRARPLPVEQVLGIARDCAEGLAAAHAHGIVHRDLKPDNVFLVAREGGRDLAKLLDFGVAKVAGVSKRTRQGMTFGTPHYMSPEQAMGEAVDGRADVYALGIVLYECLAGEVPFVADTFMGVLTKHVYAQPEPLHAVARDAAGIGVLGDLVARCLAKRAEDRFTARELVAALEQVAAGRGAGCGAPTSSVRRPLPAVPLGRASRSLTLPRIDHIDRAHRVRRRARWGLLGVFGLGAVVLVAAALSPPLQASNPGADIDPAATAPAATVPSAPLVVGPAAVQVSPDETTAASAAAEATSSREREAEVAPSAAQAGLVSRSPPGATGAPVVRPPQPPSHSTSRPGTGTQPAAAPAAPTSAPGVSTSVASPPRTSGEVVDPW